MAVRTEGVTDALIAALVAATGRPWGDGVAPGPQDTAPSYPYGVVHGLAGGVTWGNAGDPDGNAAEAIQLTSVGRTRWEAQRLAGVARGVVLGRLGSGWAHLIDAYTADVDGVGPVPRSLSADDGLVVWHREFDSTGGHFREGAVSNWVDRFVLHVQPA